jgi:hypothetical protein
MCRHKFTVLLKFSIAEQWHLFKNLFVAFINGMQVFLPTGRREEKILSAHVCVRLRLKRQSFKGCTKTNDKVGVKFCRAPA